MTVRFPFPGEAWVRAYRDALNDSPAYYASGRTWTHGAIGLAVRPCPEVPDGSGTWLDVEGGRCNDARAVPFAEAQEAPFCLTASYADWKAILRKRLDPIAGMLTRRIELKGDLLTLLRYVGSSKAMVACAASVPVVFADENDDDAEAAA